MSPSRHDSAIAIAMPPSAQSCAECSRPAAIASRMKPCTRRSRSISRRGGTPALTPCSHPLVLAATELGIDRPDQRYQVALIAKPCGAAPLHVIDDAHHADDHGRIDPGATGVVVQAHVAAHDRDVERSAGVTDALDRVVQIPPHDRMFRIGEIEAVGDRGRFRTCGDDVPRRLTDCDHRALARVECGVSRVAVGCQAQPERGSLDTNQRSIAAGKDHRRVADLLVVAPVDGCAAPEVGAAEELEKRFVRRP